ncbi:MAG: Nucleotide sugar dehydrogenase [Candidatus Uhrbacteria bacterium GW2011_GWE2_45_35]|uniref:UDP-glucose 6-dehydrogenase n=2 Tax=Candidatus Uhriibacteriota TaxID=1752732 RepID=A0A0G1JK42_9BACT|nr:MAG: Nucleotide sugar dehydrogenase [Candidatus Uhrbacteria bacterium GW2011_GWF2_44_350]KKU08387.1 MAG: Nucleotide sugar dehydrogenase [Candidatus Uhrbacteria bacterium GW2011_GWE2_45_35]HBR80518.1 UDP-glucose 6-dehydrogenase [Candidatus Uhrbacteria bacterium]HCU31714.1 UDP-glucose 6-dehydrogenase [Candidatus Uhrbacteria bacterium]
MNLVIIGTGYVGLVSGLGYARLGHRVVCVDRDVAKIAKLDFGEAPFFEPGLPELLREMQEAGRVVFTTDLASVINGADVIMIAVGTPAKPNGTVDLSAVFDVAEEIGKNLEHEAVVITKSTVPVGTNRKVLEIVRKAMTVAGRVDLVDLITVASVPEFLAEGTALQDFMKPSRIVIGVDDAVAATLIERLHDGISAPRVVTSIENAELGKYVANAFLATKISFINEIANIADLVGVDVTEIVRSIGLDPRIGSHFLRAGVGYGGSCFPKDVSALQQIAGQNGYNFKLLSAVTEVNNRQREIFVQRIEERLGNLKGRTLAVWGLSYKGGTDDIRESAAIDIVQRLFARGAEVVAYDPVAMVAAQKVLPENIEFAPTAVDATEGADALLVLTDWPEFREMSFETVVTHMLTPLIFDGRNFLADLHLKDLGFEYYGVGTR